MADTLKLNVQRVPVAEPDLDAAEQALKDALAEIERAYRREAEPILKRLAEIEGMRRYRYIMTEGPHD